MSAQGWVGRELRIAIDGEVIAAVRGKSVSFARSPIDISDGEMDGFRRLAAESDVSTVDVSVEGICTAANWPKLRALWAGEALAPVTVIHPNGSITSGDAFLSGLSRTAESGGYVAFSATLQLTGGAESGLYLTSEIYPSPEPPPPAEWVPVMLLHFDEGNISEGYQYKSHDFSPPTIYEGPMIDAADPPHQFDVESEEGFSISSSRGLEAENFNANLDAHPFALAHMVGTTFFDLSEAPEWTLEFRVIVPWDGGMRVAYIPGADNFGVKVVEAVPFESFSVVVGSDSANVMVAAEAIAWSQWTHVRVTKKDGVMRLFVGGVLIASENANWAAGTAWAFFKAEGGTESMRLDEFMVTLTCLSTANFTPPTAPYEFPPP